MPTAAVGLGAHGTSSDVRDLKSLTKKKSRCARISKSLKRTIGATAAKAHMLGVSLDSRG
jgi:hypothetical protein